MHLRKSRSGNTGIVELDLSPGDSFMLITEVINMQIKEVCKECSLTRKAVEYYMSQELISPRIAENGYRNFSEKDVDRLKKISVLRSLGLSAADIRDILSGESEAKLSAAAGKKDLEISLLREKQELLRELAQTHDWEQVYIRVHQLTRKQSVLERLRNVYPGSYGRFVCWHFAPYLNEPAVSDEQQAAFDEIIAFLDHVRLDLPDELQAYLDETMAHFDEAYAADLSSRMKEVIHNPQEYIAKHREDIESYMIFKQSGDYKETPAYHLEEALKQFTGSSGYNEIFIPAMCRLSSSYREYHEGLQKADRIFEDTLFSDRKFE